MTIMNISGINRYYNSVIVQYLKDGYIISPFSAQARYSDEYTHIDLYNEKFKNEIIRVWIVPNNNWSSTYGNSRSYICVEERKYYITPKLDDKNKSLWYHEGSFIREKKFYQVKEGKAYTDDVNDLDEIKRKRKERAENPPANNRVINNGIRSIMIKHIPANTIDKIMEMINRKTGCKHATASCLKRLTIDKGTNWYNDGKLFASIEYDYKGRTGTVRIENFYN